tara:strand:+ start:13217 stop:13885 length:669 start_codon:yes stop_codon:yes gene_type:complete
LLAASKGIILKVFPYSNTSVICNIYTDNFGKLTMMAKGVRKQKKPLLSILQPFNLVEIQYYFKKDRGIQLIKEADIIASFDNLRTDMICLSFASGILNMINKIFEKEYPNEVIFRLICRSLNKLGINIKNNKILMIFFMFHLNKQLGFMPNDKEINISLNSESVVFLEQINKTYIDDIFKIKVSSNCLSECYNFLIHFMKYHIHYMRNIKGLSSIKRIYEND